MVGPSCSLPWNLSSGDGASCASFTTPSLISERCSLFVAFRQRAVMGKDVVVMVTYGTTSCCSRQPYEADGERLEITVLS